MRTLAWCLGAVAIVACNEPPKPPDPRVEAERAADARKRERERQAAELRVKLGTPATLRDAVVALGPYSSCRMRSRYQSPPAAVWSFEWEETPGTGAGKIAPTDSKNEGIAIVGLSVEACEPTAKVLRPQRP